MRDNALARALHRSGHEVTIAPMYLPLILDETAHEGLEDVPVFFGGINVYLQQKLALFRRTPAFVERWLDSRRLLRWAARHSHMTSARDHGEMALEMLEIRTSRFRKEWEKLLDWLAQSQKPDVVCLSNALLAGLIVDLRERLGAPVVVSFQGEDSFLDSLPEPYRTRCWSAMARGLGGAAALIAPSRFYADFMQARLGAVADAIEVVPNGIDLDGFDPAPAPPANPTIGYLARMSREKGLEQLVDAFLILAGEPGDTTTRLVIAGARTAGDRPLINELERRIAAAGLASRVEWAPNLTREQKIAFFRGITLFSVPAVYSEAFGLYLIEAMACGVPVVQPESAAFPELIASTGGGICVAPRDPAALARGWRQLLADPAARAALGHAARLGVERHYSATTMCARFLQVMDRLTRAPA
jgi:glycosyltransferase involved in cell wall biosynthesis